MWNNNDHIAVQDTKIYIEKAKNYEVELFKK
jgi:hypothetical protein